MEPRPILGRLLLLAAVVAILAGAAHFLRTPRPQTIVLPDGAELTLEAVTYGKEHRYWGGSPWQGLLAPFQSMLPPRFRALGFLNYSTTNDSLCFWLRERLPFPTNTYRSFYVVDEQGRNIERGSWNLASWSPGTNIVRGHGFNAFPRRGKKILLREYEWDNQRGGRQLIAEFTVPNPARGPFPVWQPRPLPLTATNGDLEFTLTRLQNGVTFHYPEKGWATNAFESAVLASFRVARLGQSLTNWQPVGIEASDATGNRVSQTTWNEQIEDGEETMICQPGLWPGEPAWLMRVEFSRRSGFTPEELWTVRGLPATNLLPSGTQPAPTSALAQTNLFGSRLEVFPLRDGRSGLGGMELEIHVTPLPPGWRLALVKIMDEQGRELTSGGTCWGAGQCKFSLRDLTNSLALDVTVALHQSRFVEYLAHPEEK